MVETISNDKAQAVIALAESKLGDPYVYGTSGHKCTPEVRRRYASYHPEYKDKIYGACPVLSQGRPGCAGCKWNGHLCYDCRGFTAYVLKTAAGIRIEGGGATSQYNTAGNWAARGLTKDGLPDLVCCLFKQRGQKMSHTGLHIGGGDIIHCSTVVKHGSTSDTSWTHWAIPKGLYTDDELKKAGVVAMRSTLRRGSRGDDVRDLQFDLYSLGYDQLEIDGIFGLKTDAAVREFQRKCGLTADGIVGPLTWSAIEGMLQSFGRADLVDDPDSAPPSADDQPADAPQENRTIPLPNTPVPLTYPAGQTIGMTMEAALDLMTCLQEQLVRGGSQIEITAPVGLTVTATPVAAVNLWQQIEEVAI